MVRAADLRALSGSSGRRDKARKLGDPGVQLAQGDNVAVGLQRLGDRAIIPD
jgi:hypothetical protein